MKTIDISGFGGRYEWGCQRMLQLGLEFLKQNPSFDFSGYKEFSNIYGLFAEEPENGKRLDSYIMNDPKLKEFGVTGAMHQAVISHLAWIHKRGYDNWIETGEKHGHDIYEFEKRYPNGYSIEEEGKA